MKTWLAVGFGMCVLGGVAQAQTTPPVKGYIEGVAQSAFGNATSQSYGAEGGVTIKPGLLVFVEGGRTNNVAPSGLESDALVIGGYLSHTQSGSVSYTAKEPVAFGVAGLKYQIATTSKAEPYVLAGAGVARYKQDVRFLVGGTDVTSNLSSYGVVLGSDLSGDFSSAMIILGGGVEWPVWQRVVLDLQYRYGRIFAKDQGINVNRAGIGVGVRF